MLPTRVAPLLVVSALGALGCFYEWEVLDGPGGTGASGTGGSGANGGEGAACPDCPVLLADDQLSPRAIAVEDGHVYWANSDATATDDALLRVPVEGGALEPLAIGIRSPLAIALDADFVYVTEYVADGRLLRVPRAGGAATPLDLTGEPLIGVAVDANAVYFCSVSGNLQKWMLPNGPTVSLGSTGNNTSLITVVNGYVYGTRAEAGAGIWRVPTGGGPTEVIAPEASGTAGIATNGSVLVYTVFDSVTPQAGAVRRIGLAGESPLTVASGQGQPAEVAILNGRAYWTNAYDGTITRGELDAGSPTVLASDQASPNGIVVDDDNVYWTNHVSGGQVMKLAH